MRAITGQVTREIQDYLGETQIDRADAFPISTYRKLVEQVAKLSYFNKDYLLFYRGQGIDYRNRAGASTFYPTIYRGDYIPQREMTNRFKILESAADKLREIFEKEKFEGYSEFIDQTHVQWGVLQHYGVCSTPLFDLTHSLRVACSFAQMEAQGGYGYVYVFGMPYITHRISHNSEHYLFNVRLLSICPPEALRPYFQEGYLAGTEDITDKYRNKEVLDFRNRLIAKFQIPSQVRFWGDGFSKIPESVLYPRGDRIEKLCKELKFDYKSQFKSGELGDFLVEWAELENYLLEFGRNREERVLSIGETINVLPEIRPVEKDTVSQLHDLRKFRNVLVHEPNKITTDDIEKQIVELLSVKQQIGLN
jgi:hypothetical protein